MNIDNRDGSSLIRQRLAALPFHGLGLEMRPVAEAARDMVLRPLARAGRTVSGIARAACLPLWGRGLNLLLSRQIRGQ